MEVDSDVSDQDVVKLALEGGPEGALKVQLRVADADVKQEAAKPEPGTFVPGACHAALLRHHIMNYLES